MLVWSVLLSAVGDSSHGLILVWVLPAHASSVLYHR